MILSHECPQNLFRSRNQARRSSTRTTAELGLTACRLPSPPAHVQKLRFSTNPEYIMQHRLANNIPFQRV